MGVLAGVGRVSHLLALTPLFNWKSDSQHFGLSQLSFGELQLCLLTYDPRMLYLYEGSGGPAGVQLLNQNIKTRRS